MTDVVASAAMSSATDSLAARHLLRDDGQEDLCFGLWHPSRGSTRTTALLSDLVLPVAGDRSVHGNVSFMPAFFERALRTAVESGAGLALLHSHPGGAGWQGMSADDVAAERGHAAAALAATGRPLLGLTIAGDGAWSARAWPRVGPKRYERRDSASVRVSGGAFRVTYNDSQMPPPPTGREEWRRSVAAWGAAVQANLAGLHVGLVGAGSVGSVVGEGLARTGIGRVTVIDFDTVELLNLDRLLHGTRLDALCHRSKAEVLGRAMRRGATNPAFTAAEVESGVTEERGYRTALDCDILVSCVDRPWARSVLNFISYAHLIPVVDGGIRVEVNSRGELKRADWRAHVAAPGRLCLECLGQYDPAMVAVERDGYLDDPTYIQGLPHDHLARRNENVFAFSVSAASFQLLQMLLMALAPLGIADAGAQMYHFVPGLLDEPRLGPCPTACPYGAMHAIGDDSTWSVTALHAAAERARSDRAEAQRKLPLGLRLASWGRDCADWLERSLVRRTVG
ncbi:MAG: ThiF family adenylyltransferase [Vicinamibacterales bacterium]